MHEGGPVLSGRHEVKRHGWGCVHGFGQAGGSACGVVMAAVIVREKISANAMQKRRHSGQTLPGNGGERRGKVGTGGVEGAMSMLLTETREGADRNMSLRHFCMIS